MSRDKSQAPKTFETHYTTSLDSPLMSYKMGSFGSQRSWRLVGLADSQGWSPKDLIIIIFKGGEKEDLNNWRPITLLNVAYKIFCKSIATLSSTHANGDN
jgi:hypothetical protein